MFERDWHIMYLQMNYEILPSRYEGQEINCLTLAYFVISSLHILHALDHVSFRHLFPWYVIICSRLLVKSCDFWTDIVELGLFVAWSNLILVFACSSIAIDLEVNYPVGWIITLWSYYSCGQCLINTCVDVSDSTTKKWCA